MLSIAGPGHASTQSSRVRQHRALNEIDERDDETSYVSLSTGNNHTGATFESFGLPPLSPIRFDNESLRAMAFGRSPAPVPSEENMVALLKELWECRSEREAAQEALSKHNDRHAKLWEARAIEWERQDTAQKETIDTLSKQVAELESTNETSIRARRKLDDQLNATLDHLDDEVGRAGAEARSRVQALTNERNAMENQIKELEAALTRLGDDLHNVQKERDAAIATSAASAFADDKHNFSNDQDTVSLQEFSSIRDSLEEADRENHRLREQLAAARGFSNLTERRSEETDAELRKFKAAASEAQITAEVLSSRLQEQTNKNQALESQLAQVGLEATAGLCLACQMSSPVKYQSSAGCSHCVQRELAQAQQRAAAAALTAEAVSDNTKQQADCIEEFCASIYSMETKRDELKQKVITVMQRQRADILRLKELVEVSNRQKKELSMSYEEEINMLQQQVQALVGNMRQSRKL